MYIVRLWKRGDTATIHRFNGGSWFAELVDGSCKSYKTITTFTLISGCIVEVVEELPQDYLDHIIQEEKNTLSEWSYKEITNTQNNKDISEKEREQINSWFQKTSSSPFQIPKAKSLQTSREKALPSRKAPAHISGRLMDACLIDGR